MELLLQYKKCLAHLGTIAIIALLLLENYPGHHGLYPVVPCLRYISWLNIMIYGYIPSFTKALLILSFKKSAK